LAKLDDGLSSPVVIRPGTKSAPNQISDEVPAIDLRDDPPGLDELRIREWVDRDQQVFRDRKSWDEQSQLLVAEVAVSRLGERVTCADQLHQTTLIVTPPSLLTQWISEMRRHAPSLRVCIYEGWKSLAKVFERDHQAIVKLRQAKAEKKKREAADKFRKQTVRKYSKSGNGSRVKVESDIENEDDDTEEAEIEGTAVKTQRLFVDYIRAHDVVITTYK